MSFYDNAVSPTDRAMQAVSAAGIELPADVVAAVAVTTAVRDAQNEQLPNPPARPAVVTDAAAAIAGHAENLLAHTAAASAVNARLQAAAALQPVADAQVARAVTVAAAEMTEAVVAAFNAAWAACPAYNAGGDQRHLHRLDRLYEARLAAGALCGEFQHQLTNALIIFEIDEPQPAGPLTDTPNIDRLNRWAAINAGPYERWHLTLPPYPVKMVGPDDVQRRLTALYARTNAAPEQRRVSPRMGAAYDRPLPAAS